MNLHVSPGVYCREEGALAKAGAYAKHYGVSACLIGGHKALAAVRQPLVKSLAEADIGITGEVHFGGECSWANVDLLAAQPAVHEAAVLFGIGGGKAIDTAKLLAYKLNKPLITVPTVAATCAAWTTLSVVYDSQGAFVEVSYQAANPKAVLADTGVLLRAPGSFMIAGIGDTLAKWYEGEACTRGVAVTQHGAAGLSLAKMVCDRLFVHGPAAVEAAASRQSIPAFEETIDAIIMYAGLISNIGGDDCRCAAAHSIYSAFTILPPVHQVLHGAIVSFGILCQMMMDGKPEQDIGEFIQFSQKIGLPVTLAELKLDGVSRQDLKRVAAVSLTVPEMACMPYPVTAGMVLDAIIAADSKGREWNRA